MWHLILQFIDQNGHMPTPNFKKAEKHSPTISTEGKDLETFD